MKNFHALGSIRPMVVAAASVSQATFLPAAFVPSGIPALAKGVTGDRHRAALHHPRLRMMQSSAGFGFECGLVPSQIYAIGMNYVNHASEMQKPIPERPIVFSKGACMPLVHLVQVSS